MPAYRRILRPCLPTCAACHPPWRLSGQAPTPSATLDGRTDDLDVVSRRELLAQLHRFRFGSELCEAVGELAEIRLEARGREQNEASGSLVACVPEGVRASSRDQDVRARGQVDSAVVGQEAVRPGPDVEG